MRRPGRGGAVATVAHPEEAIGPDRQDQGPQPPVDGGCPRPALAPGPPAQAVGVRRGERPARPGLAPMGAEAPGVGSGSQPRPAQRTPPNGLVLPGPSGRGRQLPLGFEPVVPVGADGLAPRQPEVVGVERDRLGGGTPALSLGAEGRRNATRLDRLRLGPAHRRGRQDFVLPRRGRGPGGSLPAGWALGHLRSLATWAARADTRLRERLACVPGLPLPRAGGWFAWITLARSDPCPGKGPAGPIHGPGRPLPPPSRRAGYVGASPSVIDREPPEG